MPRTQMLRAHKAPEGIDNYLRALDRAPVMRADRERDKAMEIRELRRGYWAALLSFGPLVGPVVSEASSHLGAKRSKLPRAATEHAQKLDAFIDALVDLDGPCDAADRILADLGSQLSGSSDRGPLATAITDDYREYVRNVQRRRAALLASRREFAAANLRLVVSVARRYRGNGFIRFPDLIQEGNVGLMMAIDRFDPRRGFRFSTYAAWWIKHAITRALSDRGRVVRLPVHMIETRAQLRKASRIFQQKNGRKPTETELAEISNVPLAKVQQMARVLVQPDRMKPAAGEAPDADALDRLPDAPEDPAEMIDEDARQAVLEEGMKSLRPLESEILQLRFGLADGPPMTLREVGQRYSLSRERIRQLQNRALGQLRERFEQQGFESPFAA